jgi:hypothetical protein
LISSATSAATAHTTNPPLCPSDAETLSIWSSIAWLRFRGHALDLRTYIVDNTAKVGADLWASQVAFQDPAHLPVGDPPSSSNGYEGGVVTKRPGLSANAFLHMSQQNA